MARRSDHTREELEELILSTGEALLDEGGIAAFGARKIATRIGYTVGTLYHVFGSYDNLLLHINARTLDHWFSETLSALAARPDAPLHALADSYIRFSRTHYHRWLALFEHHLPDDAPVPEWFEPKMRRFFTLLEEVLRALNIGGDDAVRRGARLLWSSIHGIAVLSATHKLDLVTQESAGQLAQEAVDNFLASAGKA